MKYLKKTLVLSLMIITTLACSSDELENGSDQVSQDNIDKLRGSWRLIASETNGTEDDLSGTCELFNTIDFNSSNSMNVNTTSGTNCGSIQSQHEEYSVNGSVLIVGDTTLDILTLNTTTLKVKYRNENNYTETYSKI